MSPPERAEPPLRSLIVGTAGHIDHGKSALVQALTGTDPDRLKEERERGITIDLGFAHCDLGAGVVASFVDVPGHERFVRNMLAGAHGIDAIVLVVAADESVMPQTREHFHIGRLLEVPPSVRVPVVRETPAGKLVRDRILRCVLDGQQEVLDFTGPIPERPPHAGAQIELPLESRLPLASHGDPDSERPHISSSLWEGSRCRIPGG